MNKNWYPLELEVEPLDSLQLSHAQLGRSFVKIDQVADDALTPLEALMLKEDEERQVKAFELHSDLVRAETTDDSAKSLSAVEFIDEGISRLADWADDLADQLDKVFRPQRLSGKCRHMIR